MQITCSFWDANVATWQNILMLAWSDTSSTGRRRRNYSENFNVLNCSRMRNTLVCLCVTRIGHVASIVEMPCKNAFTFQYVYTLQNEVQYQHGT